MPRVIRNAASIALSLALLSSTSCRRASPPLPDQAVPATAAAKPEAPATAAPDAAAADLEAAGLRYLERVTGGASASDPLPLVVGIHGRGGRPENFGRALATLSSRARVILPYAPTAAGDGFTWFADWNGDAELAAEVRPAADRIAAMMKDIAARRPTVGKPLVTGFSQGGMLSFAIAVIYPDVVRAVFPISGFLARGLAPGVWPPGAPKPPVFAFHGSADDRVPVEAARSSVQRLKDLGLDARLTEYAGVGHRVVPEMQRDIVDAIEAALPAPRDARRGRAPRCASRDTPARRRLLRAGEALRRTPSKRAGFGALARSDAPWRFACIGGRA